jgi:hypothetical protein
VLSERKAVSTVLPLVSNALSSTSCKLLRPACYSMLRSQPQNSRHRYSVCQCYDP